MRIRVVNRHGMGDVADLAAAFAAGKVTPVYQRGLSYKQRTPMGLVDSAIPYTDCLAEGVAQQIAALLGASIVDQAPVVDPNPGSPIPTCPFLSLPGGGLVNAADIAYYAGTSPSGTQTLVQMLAQALGEGVQQSQYNAATLAQLQAGVPSSVPMPIAPAAPITTVGPVKQAPAQPPAQSGASAGGGAGASGGSSNDDQKATGAGSSGSGGSSQPAMPPSPTPPSSSLSSWFTQSMFGGVPNWAVLALVGVGLGFMAGGKS